MGAPKDIVRVQSYSMWVPKLLQNAEVASILRLVKPRIVGGMVLAKWKMISRKMVDSSQTIVLRIGENSLRALVRGTSRQA